MHIPPLVEQFDLSPAIIQYMDIHGICRNSVMTSQFGKAYFCKKMPCNKLEVKVTSNGYLYVPYRRMVTEYFDIPDSQDYISASYIMDYLISRYLHAEGIGFANMGAFVDKRYEDSQEFVCMSIGDIFDQLANPCIGLIRVVS